MYDNEEEASEFEDIFVQVAEQVELKHNFEDEIRDKKEQEKIKMIREI